MVNLDREEHSPLPPLNQRNAPLPSPPSPKRSPAAKKNKAVTPHTSAEQEKHAECME